MRYLTRDNLRSARGLTLVEMVAVGAILTILAVVSYPAITGAIMKSRVNSAKNSLILMRGALNRFYASKANETSDGQYPEKYGITTEFDPTNVATNFVYATNFYWTQPAAGVRDYEFLYYTASAGPPAAKTYSLCIRALDAPVDSDKTVLRIKEDGTITTEKWSVVTVAPLSSWCAAP